MSPRRLSASVVSGMSLNSSSMSLTSAYLLTSKKTPVTGYSEFPPARNFMGSFAKLNAQPGLVIETPLCRSGFHHFSYSNYQEQKLSKRYRGICTRWLIRSASAAYVWIQYALFDKPDRARPRMSTSDVIVGVTWSDTVFIALYPCHGGISAGSAIQSF